MKAKKQSSSSRRALHCSGALAEWGETAAGSTSLKRTNIDMQPVQFKLTFFFFFSTHPPSFLSPHPFTPNFLSSSHCFCQTRCKTVSEQLFGKQQLEENRDFFWGEGVRAHTDVLSILQQERPKKKKNVFIISDNAFLEQK